MAWPFLFVIDDALFYLVIGRNAVAGRGLTFSQVMPTNGFQPLWQTLVTVIIWLCELLGLNSATGQLRVVMLIGWLLLAAGMVVADRLLRELGAQPSGRFVALVGILAFLGGPGFTLATEANLVLVVAGATMLSAHRLVASPGRRVLSSAVTGLLVGLLMLARLDTVFLAGVVVVGVGLIGQHRPMGTRLAQTAVTGGVAALIVAPYLAWNIATFDHLMPIAGAIKVDTSQFGFSARAVGTWAWVLLTVAVGAAVVAFHGRTRGPAWSWWLVSFLGAGLASAFYYCYSAIAWTGAGWYDVPQLFAAALAAAPAADRVLSSPSRFVRPVLIGGLAVFILLAAWVDVAFYLTGDYRNRTESVVRFGDRLREVVGVHEVIAVVDFPGVLGLTSERPIVAFDGLTGDFAYQEHLRDRGPSCTFAGLGVRYVIARDDRGLERRDAIPPAWVLAAGSSIHDAGWDQLVFNSEDQLLADQVSRLRLFRYEPACAEAAP